MSQPARILIVDDHRSIREELTYALEFEGYECAEAVDGRAALDAIQAGGLALVLLDIKMPGLDGLEVLSRTREAHPDLPVIMISGHAEVETAVVAIKNGAFDFLTKPFDTDRVLVAVKNALKLSSLSTENQRLRVELADEHRILGQSPAIEELRRLIERTAPTEAQVLVTGENGTGKELVARQLHALSKRRGGPFVAVNCAAIPASLIESELFGHERGAFTGANTARKGHFENAVGGTLFLDEIGDMAVEAQAKLLRALQDKEVTRVGGNRALPVDVRVVAATNQDLKAMVDTGDFREDLYYRLHVIPIQVPPLRDRRTDVPLLATHFLAASARKNGVTKKRLTKEAEEWLRGLPWPGNVRELRNLCEAATILVDGDDVDAEALQGVATPTAVASGDGDFYSVETLEEFRGSTEKEFIRRKLEENGGNIKRTAERIGIQRSNLYKKLDRYGLK